MAPRLTGPDTAFAAIALSRLYPSLAAPASGVAEAEAGEGEGEAAEARAAAEESAAGVAAGPEGSGAGVIVRRPGGRAQRRMDVGPPPPREVVAVLAAAWERAGPEGQRAVAFELRAEANEFLAAALAA